MAVWRKTFRVALVAAAALATTACSSDPAFWEAVALGLDEVAAEAEYEAATCYWGAIPGGDRYGVQQRYCPGDYGYRPPVDLPVSYYRRNARQHDGRGDGHDRDRRRDKR